MYDPASGRFTTKDSWQGDYNRPLSLNRWNYVDANPVNYTDPSGHCKRFVYTRTGKLVEREFPDNSDACLKVFVPFLNNGDFGDIDYNDLRQGNIGDCYLLSVLGAIARIDPNIIRNLITDNQNGTYTVRLRDSLDISYDFTVSPIVAVNNSGGSVVGFGDQVGNQVEIWPLIMEMAFAELHHGYGPITNGTVYPQSAMFSLTEKSSTVLNPANTNFQSVYNYFTNGAAITATTYIDWGFGIDIPDITGTEPLYTKGTLQKNHVYFVTDMTKDRQDGNSISLYNPWGFSHVQLKYDDFKRTFRQMTITQFK